jgi:hypothetical protein
MFDQDDEELTFDVESNDDDTEIALVVRSVSGKKISQHEFVMMLEMYLHQVAEADILRTQTGALNH